MRAGDKYAFLFFKKNIERAERVVIMWRENIYNIPPFYISYVCVYKYNKGVVSFANFTICDPKRGGTNQNDGCVLQR